MNPRVQIYSAAFGVAALAFGLGIQLALSIVSGVGWWSQQDRPSSDAQSTIRGLGNARSAAPVRVRGGNGHDGNACDRGLVRCARCDNTRSAPASDRGALRRR